jgi:hypothetical protein
MANKFTDNEGLFQGGRLGRFGGRFRDWWEDNTQDPYGHRDRRARESLSSKMGTDMPETYTKTIIEPSTTMEPSSIPSNAYQANMGSMGQPTSRQGQLRTYDKEMPLDQAASMARSQALDFDVSNPDSVRILQQRLNESGYTDSEGNPLEVDSMFGEKTEFALRNLQNDLQSQQFGFQNQPQAPSQLSTASNRIPNNSTDPLGQFKLDYPDVAANLARQGNKAFSAPSNQPNVNERQY